MSKVLQLQLLSICSWVQDQDCQHKEEFYAIVDSDDGFDGV
jgi:hypothetical protein